MPLPEVERAKARIRRAERAQRDPSPMDLELVATYKLEKEQEKAAPNNQFQSLPQEPIQLLPPSSPIVNQTKQYDQGPDLRDIQGDRKPQGAREKSWYDFFSKRFGPFVLMFLWFTTTDLERASFYAPSPDECKTAALPLAKICTRIEDWLRLPAWAHDVVTSSDDIMTLGMVCMQYLDRIGMLTRLAPYFTGTAARMGRMNKNDKSQPVGNDAPVHSGDIEGIPSELAYGIGAGWRAD